MLYKIVFQDINRYYINTWLNFRKCQIIKNRFFTVGLRDFNIGLCTIRSQDRVWNASETGFATKYFLAEHLAEDP